VKREPKRRFDRASGIKPAGILAEDGLRRSAQNATITAVGTKSKKLRWRSGYSEEATMRLILLIIVILLVVGALPTWPYSSGWGFYPSGGLGLAACRT
jgi:hypothetical protein